MVSRLASKSSTATMFEVPFKYCGIVRGGFPEVISKGVFVVPECWEVLYDHSAHIKNLPQVLGLV